MKKMAKKNMIKIEKQKTKYKKCANVFVISCCNPFPPK